MIMATQRAAAPDIIPQTVVGTRRRFPSDATRVARRREQKRLAREAAIARGEEREKALKYAMHLSMQLEEAPDEQTRKELRRIINGIRLRYPQDENAQRLAVLRALESREILTRAEIIDITKLARQTVQEILDDFTSAAVDLVSIHTMGGKRDCGRNGTTLYYKLKH